MSARLPFSACFVVRACTRLSWGEKAVWLELYSLDRGPEGAWISDRSLGQVLGLDPGTAKNYRFRLRKLGLARTVARPGTQQVGWIVQLPHVATPDPKEKKVWGQRATELAAILDQLISSEAEPPPGGASNAEIAKPAMPRLPSQQCRDYQASNAEIAGSAAALEGGQGGGSFPPPSVPLSETQFLPAVREEGMFAQQTGKAGTGERPAPSDLILPLMTVQEGGKSRDAKIADWRAAAAAERARKEANR